MRRIEQSVDRQIALLENYRKHGLLHRLGFAVEMDLPKAMRGCDGKRYAVAEVPPGKIPYIPVVDEYFVSMALADLLVTLFERDNAGKGIEFYPAICTVDLMDDMYVYGSTESGNQKDEIIDLVCMGCGGVKPVPASQLPTNDYFYCNHCLEVVSQ